MKAAGDYYWAIILKTGRSCWGRSDSRVVCFAFQLEYFVYACLLNHMHTQFRLTPELPEHD
jgi:hypothetical protein